MAHKLIINKKSLPVVWIYIAWVTSNRIIFHSLNVVLAINIVAVVSLFCSGVIRYLCVDIRNAILNDTDFVLVSSLPLV